MSHNFYYLQRDKVVGSERSHDLSSIWLDDSAEDRDRSWDGLFAQESEDTKLGKTSVVDFGQKTLFFCLFAHILAELEWIVVVEWNRVRDSTRSRDEVGEVTGLSTLHVVLVTANGELTPELKETNKAEDLPLGVLANGVPQGRGVGLAREWSSVHLHGPGEFDSVGVNNVSNEGEHSNTSMPVIWVGALVSK